MFYGRNWVKFFIQQHSSYVYSQAYLFLIDTNDSCHVALMKNVNKIRDVIWYLSNFYNYFKN